MQRSAEFMRPGELVAPAADPYMNRVPRPGRDRRGEAEKSGRRHPPSHRESAE